MARKKNSASPAAATSSEIITDSRLFLKKMYKDAELSNHASTVAKALARIHDVVLALASFRLFDLQDAMEQQAGNLKWDFHFHKALL